MKVLIAGGTGAIGKPLLSCLDDAGPLDHDGLNEMRGKRSWDGLSAANEQVAIARAFCFRGEASKRFDEHNGQKGYSSVELGIREYVLLDVARLPELAE